MKKVLVASLLSAAALVSMAPGAVVAFAQAPAAAAPAQGKVELSPAEYAAYNNATTQATPAAKVAALEAYLTAYPQSTVKADVLGQLVLTYSNMGDGAKTVDAADRLLQIDPTNLRALTFEVVFRKQAADAITDDAARQTALDAAAGFAQKGLAAEATLPKGMTQADFDSVKAVATPIFYSAIGGAAVNKKDMPAAIEAYKSELTSVPLANTTVPGPILQDTFILGQAYYGSNPPDYVNCTFYATRAAVFAPDAFKPKIQPLATYCYHKYHGQNDEGYDAVIAAARANLMPPADFKIVPAPKPADIVHTLVSGTADLATLNVGDKEFILQNGAPEDAEKVWNTMKDKSVEIPGALVIESTPTVLKVAISEDAVQSKTADYTFNMAPVEATGKTPAAVAAAKKKAEAIAAATAVGQKVTLTGKYTSYTASPIMIVMSEGDVVLAKKAAPAPAHHAPVRRK